MSSAHGHPCHALAQVTRALLADYVELDAETFADVMRAVAVAQADGYPFDAFTLALLDTLQRQMDDEDMELCVCDCEDDRTVVR